MPPALRSTEPPRSAARAIDGDDLYERSGEPDPPASDLGRIVRRLADQVWFLAFLGLAPLLVCGGVLIASLTSHEDDIATRRVQAAALRAAHLIDRAIQEQLGLLYGLAASTALDTGEFANFRAEAERLWRLHPEWRTVILTDDKRQVVNLRFAPGAELPAIRDPESLAATWATQRPLVGDLREQRASFRVPVVRSGETRFTLVAAIEPELFSDALEAAALNAGWRANLGDRAGFVVGAAGDGAAPIGASVSRSLARFSAPDEMGAFPVIEAEGSYLASARVGATGWQVLIDVPTPLIKGRLIETKLAVWAGLGMAAAFTLLLTGALLRHWATRREVHRLGGLNAALRRAVGEKETLLAEVHHRVKNNLQLVEALMAFQSNDVADKRSLEAWDVLRRRIRALALVHQQLLHSDDLTHFDLRQFVEDLCRNIERAFSPGGKGIRIVADVDEIMVDLDFAIPLGLLINEFASNAFKHAFPASRSGPPQVGEIRVSIHNVATGQIKLVVADNGVGSGGVGGGAEPTSPGNGSGLIISQSLIAQLRGTLAVTSDAGTKVEVVMPVPETKGDPRKLQALDPRGR